jgi:PIN domain
MEWYHRGRGPFGPKKQKEFPDAIALAAILNFSKREKCSIAVVSQDSDFKRALGDNECTIASHFKT